MIYDFYINDKLTDKILEFEMSEDLEDVATSFSFSSLENYDIAQNDVLNSLKICKKGDTTPFYMGYITDCEHTTDVNVWNYQGFDVGFYLNKNEVIKQFKNANIGDAIDSLCREFEISLKSRPKFNCSVSRIYKDVIFSDILKELLQLEYDKGGLKNIYIDCKQGKLEILKYQIEAQLSSEIANKVFIDAKKTINTVSVKHSMQELKNRVVYADNNEKSIKSKFADDTKSIAKYGLLQTIETVDTKKTNNLQKLAETKLDELNKESESISFSLLGSPRVGKGKVIDINEPDYDLNTTYLIKSCHHRIDNQKHECSLILERIVL